VGVSRLQTRRRLGVVEPAIPYPLFLGIVVTLLAMIVGLLTAPLWAKGTVLGIKLGRKSIQEAKEEFSELDAHEEKGSK